MKHQKLIYRSALLLAMSLWFTAISAQDFSERMVYEGHYSAPEGSTLELSNKYGDIQLHNWDKDSIFITTELILTSTSHANLRKLKDNVRIKYETSNQRIKAYTDFNDNTSEVLNQLQEFTKSIIPNQVKRIEANYTIYLPKHISLKIRNQYGDITIDDILGNVDIDLFNGALSANRLTGASSFDLHYAKASINQINDGDFDLIYSDLDLRKALSLNLVSKISDIHLQDVGVCKLRSTRDDINIDRLAYLYGESNYSKIRIIEFTQELSCDLSYGKLDISRLAPTCSSIDIRSDRTDVSIYTPQSIDYTYNITYHPDAMVHLPFQSEAITVEQHNQTMYNTSGQTNENTHLNIKISAYRRCLIRIQDIFN